MFTHPNNFGPYDHSVVKTGKVNFIPSTLYSFASLPSSEPYKWITGIGNGGKIADIVYIAYPAVIDQASMNLILNYMKKGGVVVAFLEYRPSVEYLARGLFGVSNIEAIYNGSAAGSVYAFPAHETMVSATDKEAVMRSYEGDPILNGPFGDIREKQWGEDASLTASIRGIPSNISGELTIYSNSRDISGITASPDLATFFRYESDDYNIIWVGDGGFMSSATTGEPWPSTTICPFYWDTTTFFPISKDRYGRGITQYPVYNSTAFCNIMAWAIRKSESLRAKRNT